MQAFHLNAVSLSSIAALFYIAYVIMQIPSGLLYDRYGPRYLLTGAVLICALGTLLFAITNQIWLLSLGRFMTGFGGAFAFIGVLVLASSWFPARYFALIAGIVQFLGSMGALVGEAPLSAAATTYGWRHTLIGLCLAGVLIAFFIWLIVHDRPEHMSTPARPKFGAGELHRLRVVLSSRQSWLVGLYNFAI
jgi:MFS family permease